MSEKAIQQKQVIVNEIVKKIENAKSVTLVEFDKMDVKEITDLRNNFRDANTEYKVYKNTMMRFAFQQLGFDQFTEELKGSNALIFSNEEMVDGPKVARKYIDKDDANKDKLIIKSGVVDGNYQTPDEMLAIAKLPGQQELASMLVNTLQAPIRKLAGDYHKSMQNLFMHLMQLEKKKKTKQLNIIII